ncbi:MAG: prolyl oligopeptidase family serine peptidase [Clostridium sp.]|nr:MAG: prolyl oligopeptidase family serine peptidase [Clostridium sp.]
MASQFLGFAKFNGLIIGYPVVSSDENIAHLGSFRDLLGPKFKDEEMRKLVSIEKQITLDAPDLFLWTTLTDQAVPMENSLKLVEAYHMVGANVEFHLYPLGMHGLSLATKETSGGDDNKVIEHIQSWMLLVKNWLKLKF